MYGTHAYYIILTLLNTFVVIAALESLHCPDVENKDDVMFSIKCYHYVDHVEEQILYSNAEEDCKSRNGHLVTVRDNVTQVEIVNHLQFLADSHTVLLGLKKVDGQWKWTTGETLGYSNWDRDSSCRGSCECAKMKVAAEGRWEMFGCETSDWYTVYVCEYDMTASCSTVCSQPLLITVCAVFVKVLHQLLKIDSS